jgi:hypothetical protein
MFPMFALAMGAPARGAAREITKRARGGAKALMS